MKQKHKLINKIKVAFAWRYHNFIASPLTKWKAKHIPAEPENPYDFNTAKNYWGHVPRAKGSDPILTQFMKNKKELDIRLEFDKEMEIAKTKPERKKAFSMAFESIKHLLNPKVIDYGSGFGFNGMALLSNHPTVQVTFVDINENNLQTIQKISKSKNIFERTSYFHVKDKKSKDLTFSEKFDMIISMGVLHHTPYAPEIVDHLTTFVKPNGIFLVMLYNYFYEERMALRKKRKLNKNTFGELTDPTVGEFKNPYSDSYDDEKTKKLFHKYILSESAYPDPFYNMYKFQKK